MSEEQVKILCIEDNTQNGIFFRRILEQEGYEVLIEVTWKAGLKKAVEIEPDLIIVDHRLPDFYGVELPVEIREQKKLQDTPILLTFVIGSGRRGYPFGEWVSQSPLNETILKPIHVREFREKVASLLEISGRANRI